MRIPRLRALLLGAVLLPALATTAQAGTAPQWQDGKHDEDQVIDCITQSPGTGVSAEASWSPNGREVPEVGETFYIRGYAGLVSLPCSGKVAVVPEVLIPAGVEYGDDADHPVRWALTAPGKPQQLSTDRLPAFRGVNGGVVFEKPGGGAWTLRQGWVLEIQVPVRATQVLKGPASQQPECQDRREGDAPCPVSQAGDHLQFAFTVGGHGGTKSYVIPYVALFAQRAGGGPTDPVTKAPSTTSATYSVSSKAKGRAAVTVRSKTTPTGRVVVLDGRKQLGTATLKAGSGGRVTVTIPKLGKGKHVLVVKYAGSSTVKPSVSAKRTVTVR